MNYFWVTPWDSKLLILPCHNVCTVSCRSNENAFLHSLARDNTQLLINEIWKVILIDNYFIKFVMLSLVLEVSELCLVKEEVTYHQRHLVGSINQCQSNQQVICSGVDREFVMGAIRKFSYKYFSLSSLIHRPLP